MGIKEQYRKLRKRLQNRNYYRRKKGQKEIKIPKLVKNPTEKSVARMQQVLDKTSRRKASVSTQQAPTESFIRQLYNTRINEFITEIRADIPTPRIGIAMENYYEAEFFIGRLNVMLDNIESYLYDYVETSNEEELQESSSSFAQALEWLNDRLWLDSEGELARNVLADPDSMMDALQTILDTFRHFLE